jgi:integrase/recombinase XerC
MDLIKENPLVDVKSDYSSTTDVVTKYLTKETLQTIITSLLSRRDLRDIRNTTMFIMMALEGLRAVEIHRLNEEDIDFSNGIIYIRGKGHSDMIYPREDTMYMLKYYLERKEVRSSSTELVHPVFVSLSNHNKWNRVSRDGIRRSIDAILKEFGLKKHGISCHVLRHTCATLLYAETKDLQVVKETLRHRSIQMSSKYAHLQDRMAKRYTNAIPIKIKEN